jgi:hypothetical protein
MSEAAGTDGTISGARAGGLGGAGAGGVSSRGAACGSGCKGDAEFSLREGLWPLARALMTRPRARTALGRATG